MNPIEIIATLFGLACVGLTIRQNIWCWPCGLVQVSLFIVIFFQARLYSDTILHIIYIPLQIYGWYRWLHGGGPQSAPLAVSRQTGARQMAWIVATLLGSFLLGLLMHRQTDAALPYADAFTTIASLSAQWLMAQKRLESWLYWIIVDIAAIGIYLNKELYFTSGLYAVFLVLATIGFLTWRKSWQSTPEPVPS